MDTLRRGASSVLAGLLSWPLHTRSVPSLTTFNNVGFSSTSAADLIRELLLPLNEAFTLEQLSAEYEERARVLDARYRDCSLAYPQDWAAGAGLSFLIYSMVRLLQPATVIETGVANGHSSYFLLNAILENRHGTLHSIDIASDVGSLLSPAERSNWQLHRMPANSNFAENFSNLLKTLPAIDLFVQDSDHWYGWVRYELETVFERLAEGAMIVADDVDSSFAFLDFCSNQNLKPAFLVTSFRVHGFARNTGVGNGDFHR